MTFTVSNLVSAIRDGNLVPHFQPIVQLSTAKVTGYEALARIVHPRLGLLLPSDFLALARDEDVMDEMSRSLICRALLDAVAWEGPYELAINLPADQLQDISLVNYVIENATRACFPLNRLTVEVTETSELWNLVRVQEAMAQLHELGVRLALDDVGIGYSSLHYLQILPFDVLKIDMAFVHNLSENVKSRRIVGALIGLGHGLDLQVVAEGVETQSEADILNALGCDFAQGWLFGRPQATVGFI